MVMVDDPTSMITALHFDEEESLEAYYQTFAKHINEYGIPDSLYGDRCSVLVPRIVSGPQNITQFQKANRELGVKVILAHSPQAKGKVERANQTLQVNGDIVASFKEKTVKIRVNNLFYSLTRMRCRDEKLMIDPVTDYHVCVF